MMKQANNCLYSVIKELVAEVQLPENEAYHKDTLPRMQPVLSFYFRLVRILIASF